MLKVMLEWAGAGTSAAEKQTMIEERPVELSLLLVSFQVISYKLSHNTTPTRSHNPADSTFQPQPLWHIQRGKFSFFCLPLFPLKDALWILVARESERIWLGIRVATILQPILITSSTEPVTNLMNRRVSLLPPPAILN
jgi:hypothetical protein